MATDDQAKQLSCSYGFDVNLSTVQIFQQYAAQGQSFFLASGDGGAFPAVVDEPADDPYITVVGGTTLTTSSTTGNWKSEVVWLTPPDGLGDPLMASGGGVSTVYPIPSWQLGISMTTNQGSTTMRESAGRIPGGQQSGSCVGCTQILLESPLTFAEEAAPVVAAPQRAGFMAMVNQQAAAAMASLRSALGIRRFTPSAKAPATCPAFTSITTSNNLNGSSPTKYRATTGYDLCTGMGNDDRQQSYARACWRRLSGYFAPNASTRFQFPRPRWRTV